MFQSYVQVARDPVTLPPLPKGHAHGDTVIQCTCQRFQSPTSFVFIAGSFFKKVFGYEQLETQKCIIIVPNKTFAYFIIN